MQATLAHPLEPDIAGLTRWASVLHRAIRCSSSTSGSSATASVRRWSTSFGAVVWCCLPRFDSEPVFGSLLDPQGGRLLVGAADGAPGVAALPRQHERARNDVRRAGRPVPPDRLRAAIRTARPDLPPAPAAAPHRADRRIAAHHRALRSRAWLVESATGRHAGIAPLAVRGIWLPNCG